MNVNKVIKLYPNFYKVYGPYTRKDKRKIVVLYDGSKRKTILLARVKLEVKLGRRLNKDEEVDHIDEDPTNDSLENLQILPKSLNISKSRTVNAIGGRLIKCKKCSKKFKSRYCKRDGLSKFCSNSCRGKFYGNQYQKQNIP